MKTVQSTYSPVRQASAVLLFVPFLCLCGSAPPGQTIRIDGAAGGKRFDGIGAVSGGGATSVLLKDYREPQRSQVLDLLFKPKFGASLSALLVEVPGDGNSTQGSEPSHMHSRDDTNFSRGYEWWLMCEARKRNPLITLDANAWGCPGWVGGGNFWSQEMCGYYLAWIKGLKDVYGLRLDAIGCRNEKGVSVDFVKKFRATLDSNGFPGVRIHAFDNWGKEKFDWCRDMRTDSALRAAVDIISAHTMSEIPAPSDIIQLGGDLGKPIWNTEEHIYKDGFDCEISLVESFNRNFIESGVTKIVNWYLAASTYDIEPFPEQPAMIVAREPWGGHYVTRTVLWGYAHYGQFSDAGWSYLNGACGRLSGGGTYITLKSPGTDYSIIAETKGATADQRVSITVCGGVSGGALCVWRSNPTGQFVRLHDITPVNGVFDLTLEPQSIYSLSTTRGQQKGAFDSIPAPKPFPLPYRETFEEYTTPEVWGYLPHFTADIAGVFEIAGHPDRSGKCLRQVVSGGSQSWAPEWMPYTILGDGRWKDYEVTSDVSPGEGGWAGVMGRVRSTGSGYGCRPDGYCMILSADGTCSLYRVNREDKSDMGTLLATGETAGSASRRWHTLTLRFSGRTITGCVDGARVLQTADSSYAGGMAGLIAGSTSGTRNRALFDNLIIAPPGGPPPEPTFFPTDLLPIYPAFPRSH